MIRTAASIGAALLVAVTALVCGPAQPAAAVPQLSCYAAVPQEPYNNYRCDLPHSYIGREVYLQAFPKQNETGCTEPPYGQAQIHVQIATIRYGTGFHITGLWIQYDRGHFRYVFAQASAEDGNHHYPQGTWNNYGNWITWDSADKTNNDPIRFGAGPSNHVMLPWGSNGVAVLHVNIQERDTPFWLADGGCFVHPYYVTFRPGA